MSESETEQVATSVEGEAAGLPEAPVAAPTESQETDWVAEARKWEKRAKENASRLKEAEPKLSEYDRLVEASKTETERAQDAATAAQARVERLTSRAVLAEVKALAATSFADPTDATSAITPADYISADGDIDTDGIKAALEDLLSRKPHWKAEQGRRTPAPNPAQGSSASGPSSASQLTEAELDQLSRAGKFEEINKAREAGRLNDLLGIK